jgi:hypothetical protein
MASALSSLMNNGSLLAYFAISLLKHVMQIFANVLTSYSIAKTQIPNQDEQQCSLIPSWLWRESVNIAGDLEKSVSTLKFLAVKNMAPSKARTQLKRKYLLSTRSADPQYYDTYPSLSDPPIETTERLATTN